ncbi:TrmH family RNA methyltransferase [Nitratireductor alexandrii]|uniref:TrmH family RNA methyltransferase n=1 Tax=Nitratireductor alexandrii TaxID=2448161 RepID=UPI000FDCD9E4|nr:RNA methyltransferase [Nitratireductor alexandrii]
MTDDEKTGSAKDTHFARLRRAHRDRKAGGAPPRARPGADMPATAAPEGHVYLYGLHTVRAAIDNPGRTLHKLLATRNALARLEIADPDALPFDVELVEPRAIDKIAGGDAVHQGVLLDTEPLIPKPLSALGDTPLVVALDQVTDPHNVGAILRTAVAFGAGAVITTARHSPSESGVLAKSASGALEHIDLIAVRNLASGLEALHQAGFFTVGLDSEGPDELEVSLEGARIALVLGAEGKGLRQKTRATVNRLARLTMPGPIHSLNVSNAAAISLYAARRHLGKN